MNNVLTGIGEVAPHRDAEDPVFHLQAEALTLAIEDAGLEIGDVDGLLVAPQMSGLPLLAAAELCEFMGMSPTYLDAVELGGATAVGMLARASAALDAGLCRAVGCVLGDVTDTSRFYDRPLRLRGAMAAEFERPYGPFGANSGYALVAQRHAHEYGTSDAHRAKVVADQSINGAASARAVFQEVLSVREVLDSRMVCDPLRRLEIVTPCCGAAGLVVTHPKRAARPDRPAVAIRGYGERITHNSQVGSDSLTRTGLAGAAAAAFDSAGMSPQDVKVAQIYDCYSISVMVALEDSGFCGQGDSANFVASHDLTYRGDFPVNTDGGQLRGGQAGLAGGAGHVLECVRQLRGEAGTRQVANCDIGFVTGNGGFMGEQTCAVLCRQG